MKFLDRAERLARHLSYIAFFAIVLLLMERCGNTAKIFVGGLSVGLVLGSVAIIVFLAHSVSDEEE